MDKKPMRPFLDFYADQFNATPVHESNYRECARYLQGMRDLLTSELSEEAIRRLISCEELLLNAGNMVSHMRRMKPLVDE